MKDKELMDFAPQIGKLAAENSLFFCWATMPRLDFGIEFLKEAGFEYITTAFVWVKPTLDGESWNNGPGYYTASNAEVVLLGKKGKGMKPAKEMIDSVVKVSKTKHSKKPLEVIERINLMYPEKKKIELFSRDPQPGWYAWGNEARKENQQ